MAYDLSKQTDKIIAAERAKAEAHGQTLYNGADGATHVTAPGESVPNSATINEPREEAVEGAGKPANAPPVDGPVITGVDPAHKGADRTVRAKPAAKVAGKKKAK